MQQADILDWINKFSSYYLLGAELLRWRLSGSITLVLGPLGWLIGLGVLIGFNALMVGLGTHLFSRAEV